MEALAYPRPPPKAIFQINIEDDDEDDEDDQPLKRSKKEDKGKDSWLKEPEPKPAWGRAGGLG